MKTKTIPISLKAKPPSLLTITYRIDGQSDRTNQVMEIRASFSFRLRIQGNNRAASSAGRRSASPDFGTKRTPYVGFRVATSRIRPPFQLCLQLIYAQADGYQPRPRAAEAIAFPRSLAGSTSG